MNLFQKIFSELNKAKIKYLVVGGVAVNLYGYLRFTGDLDLLVLLEEENLGRLDKLMQKLGYIERIPVSVRELEDTEKVKEWIEKKNFKAYSFIPPQSLLLQIDIIIEESLKFQNFYNKKIIKKIENTQIPLIDLDGLIKMKKKANREKDVEDLASLLKLKNL